MRKQYIGGGGGCPEKGLVKKEGVVFLRGGLMPQCILYKYWNIDFGVAEKKDEMNFWMTAKSRGCFMRKLRFIDKRI